MLLVVAGSDATEKYEVQARGEMQLAVVIEGMRREGLELAVSPPQVLYRYSIVEQWSCCKLSLLHKVGSGSASAKSAQCLSMALGW